VLILLDGSTPSLSVRRSAALELQSHGRRCTSREEPTPQGVASLGCECFGSAGQGVLLFSIATDERIAQRGVLRRGGERADRVRKYLEAHRSTECEAL